MPKRKLAVDSDNDTDTDSDSDRPSPPRPSKHNKGKDKGKGKGKARTTETIAVDSTDEEEVASSLTGKTRDIKTSGKGKGKGKQKSRGDTQKSKNGSGSSKVNGKAKGKGKAKAPALAIDGASSSDVSTGIEEQEEEEEAEVIVTDSEGSLHGSDDEPGLGRWTRKDQRSWQEPLENDGEDDYPVDIVVRFRMHPRLNFPQYRVKWENYEDWHNTWEPIYCFESGSGPSRKGDGSPADNYWADLEFAQQGTRPDNWNLAIERGEDPNESDFTDLGIQSANANRRRRARKHKRREIRIDRKEMRKAFARKHAREDSERIQREEAEEEVAEARRRKRRQEEEEAANKSTQSTINKKVLTHGVPIRQSGMNAAGRTNEASTSKTPTGARPTPQAAPQNSEAKQPDPNQRLKEAALFVTEHDAKVKADKSRVKVGDGIVATSSTARPTRPLASTMVKAPTATSSSSVSTSSAKQSGTTPGSFRGAHKNRTRMQFLDQPRSTGGPPVPFSPLDLLKREPATSRIVNGPATSAVNSAISMAPPARPPAAAPHANEQERPRAAAAPLTFAARPAPPMQVIQRGPIRTGIDPRNRTAQPAVGPSSGIPTNGNKSPYSAMANASPLHSVQSPPHPGSVQSPREGQGFFASAMLKDATSKPTSSPSLTPAEREKAIAYVRRWKFEGEVAQAAHASYNVLERHQADSMELRRLLKLILGHDHSAVAPSFQERYKQPEKRVIMWVQGASVVLTAVEREVLALPNFRFFSYGSNENGIEEIWPPGKGKVVMYTFGALMLKLIQRCYAEKATTRWSVDSDVWAFVHPWQKDLLDQLISNDLLFTFLTQTLGEQAQVSDKEFAINDEGKQVLADHDEVLPEYCKDEPPPLLEETDIPRTILTVDEEVSQALHRLQHVWRHERRSFVLVMAKTSLVASQIPTCYTTVL